VISLFFWLFVLATVILVLIVLLLEWVGIATQAATDKTSLKAQLDDLAAEKTKLALKVDALTEEVSWFKAKSSRAQELTNQRRLEAKSKEQDLHKRL
jgi:outer membrane murein-binding lipoprotein Lpp